jgi:hypothetical protein
MRMDDRRGRRQGPGGPIRRGLEGARDHPYEGRPSWGGSRMRENRPLRSYRDLDATQDATPELDY